MKCARIPSVTVWLILIIGICSELSQTSAQEQEVASCILKVRETEKRVRNEVIEELKKEMEETLKGKMQRIDLLETEIALERTRQQVIEQKVELSYKGLMRLENALTKCTAPTSTTLAPTTTTKKPDCPVGYKKFLDHCYLFEMAKADWQTARDNCLAQDADLVSINNWDELDFLLTEIEEHYTTRRRDSYYIGVVYDDGEYMWVDGTPVTFRYWAQGEPNCMDTVCKAYISEYMGFKWADARANYKLFYICERNIN
ncbi:perlucin-like protein [Haliotis rubra]|uniref:perlucin-like protein n=1 Tax=Haliotis rubra TaxID=36100 RepID=UPI001EE61AC8|nr:perlucin-like protein [Haliotis rubra]